MGTNNSQTTIEQQPSATAARIESRIDHAVMLIPHPGADLSSAM